MPRSGLLCILCLIAALLVTRWCVAQPSSPTTRRADLPQTLLITLGPGQEIYEQFAHNALWVHNPAEPPKYQDVAFNYGLFEFGGDFLPRFIFGKMRYWMGGEDAIEMLQLYKADDRSIWIQKLNLTPDQTLGLSQFLWNNSLKENRYYTYNYYTDNCSTRIRDALDRALDGDIKRQTQSRFTGHTYRYHTLRIVEQNPLLYICLDYVHGHPADRDLSLWDEMYLPQLMQEHLRSVTVNGTPLVLAEETYARSARPPVPTAPPHWLPRFIIAGLVWSLILLVAERSAKSSRFARVCRFVFLLAWLVLTSLAGLILTFFNLFTDHWATFYNENLLQMAPFAIILLVLFPLALGRRNDAPRRPRIARFCAIMAAILLAFSALGLALKVLPGLYQDNWRIIALSLPVHVAVAMILWRAAATVLPVART